MHPRICSNVERHDDRRSTGEVEVATYALETLRRKKGCPFHHAGIREIQRIPLNASTRHPESILRAPSNQDGDIVPARPRRRVSSLGEP